MNLLQAPWFVMATTDTYDRTNNALWATTYGNLMGSVDKNAWSETDDTGWATEQ